MKKIYFYPQNKEYFEKLLLFSEIVFEICKKVEIDPVVYGSLAYAFYTQDTSTKINDIDLLVPEESFESIIKEVNKREDLSYEETDYNSLKIFWNNEIKITFDSIKHYYSNLPNQFNHISINDYPFTIVNLNALKEIYQRGWENIPFKRDDYKKKIDALAKIKE